MKAKTGLIKTKSEKLQEVNVRYFSLFRLNLLELILIIYSLDPG